MATGGLGTRLFQVQWIHLNLSGFVINKKLCTS